MSQRSTAITVIGWVLAIVSALGAFYCLLFLFLPQEQLLGLVKDQQAAMPKDMPTPDAAALVHLMRGVMFAVFVVLAWALLSALGLVKRKPWARVSCVVLMVLGMLLGALYVLIGLAASGMPSMAGAAGGRVQAMMLAGAVFAALCGWVLYMLNTAKVKQEFQPPPR